MAQEPQATQADDAARYADVLVIVPAFNEATAIGAVVADLRSQFPNVLVIDDGSTDDTTQVAQEAGAQVARHLVNIGQGGALDTAGTVYQQCHGAPICTDLHPGKPLVDDIRGGVSVVKPA